MKTKTQFTTPKIEVVDFTAQDVLTTSNNDVWAVDKNWFGGEQ